MNQKYSTKTKPTCKKRYNTFALISDGCGRYFLDRYFIKVKVVNVEVVNIKSISYPIQYS